MAWGVDLGVQITDMGRSLYIGSFCPAMTSLSRPTGKKHTNVGWDDGGK